MEKSLYKKYEEVESHHWWFRGRRVIIFDFLKKNFSDSDCRLLDFGCNTGFLVGELQKLGINAFGIDMSKGAIEFGVKRGTKNLFLGEGCALFEDNYFDVVLALDVIEHIKDHEGVIKDMCRVLRPGGILVIMVPAFMFMWGIQDEVAHHFRRYSKSELKNLALSNGFEMCRITFFNFFMFIPIVTVRLLQRIIKPKRSSDFDINSGFINFVLTRLFIFESKLLRIINFPFGVSILTVLKKK